MREAIEYIIRFLVRGDVELSQQVGYVAQKEQFSRYKVVILPSRFFDDDFYATPQSLPQLPLQVLQNGAYELSVLYGSPEIEKIGDTIVLHSDLVASTWFLLSRYEELIVKERDTHGRMSAYSSVIGKSGLLDMPIADMYSDFLLSLLGAKSDSRKINKIYLTHDVDRPLYYRYLRGCLGGLRRGRFKDVFRSLCGIENDPAWTFPMLLKWENEVQKSLGQDRVEQIYFLKANNEGDNYDKPIYDLNTKDLQLLLRLLKESNVSFGLHSSYLSAQHKTLISREKQYLETVLGFEIINHRSHYLRSCEPQSFQSLIDCGIRHDFTMAFADCSGFRLGTARQVRWIDPVNKQLTDLWLHPLTLMDVTLSDERYMNMSEEEAFNYADNLIMQTEKYGGELCLLWHNSTFAEKKYHKTLYKRILESLS